MMRVLATTVFLAGCMTGDPTGSVTRMTLEYQVGEELMNDCTGGPELIQLLLGELDGFTGPDWEQEDDITLVALQRAAMPAVTEASKSPALVS